MSDTFRIEVRAIEGTMVELLCTTLAAGGVNDLAITRSFALIALLDALPWRGRLPLQVAVAALSETGKLSDVDFHRQHVATFIASTELIERIGIIEEEDEDAWWLGREGLAVGASRWTG